MSTKLKNIVGSTKNMNTILQEIQDRILWLSMYMVDYANHTRINRGDLKVGGHQSSSASVLSLMTFLYFEYMNSGDRISIKPHASPVYHAIQYLIGNLDEKYLNTLRGFHGLQAYPSRTKDPDNVDFSTGSVGLGAVAPNFSWLTEEFVRNHFNPDSGKSRKYISLVGDAELDEGSVWEAIGDPTLSDVRNVLWVVDLNRQSLDRIIPGIRVGAWREMFSANGWQVVDAKYGNKLQNVFKEPNGEILRNAIDGMPNELYQRLLRLDSAALRDWLPRASHFPDEMTKLISRWDDQELKDLFLNLGGHDFDTLRDTFAQVNLNQGPAVIFAYTFKGWKLPTIGDPQNHSVNLNVEQMEELRKTLKIRKNQITSRIDPKTNTGKFCIETGNRLIPKKALKPPIPSVKIPSGFGRTYGGKMSTQQIFGLVLTEISRNVPELSKRVVTVSPDVASSTNLGGWINKVGVWTNGGKHSLPKEEVSRALQWIESEKGQHVELGISENNLFMLLGQLGLSYEMNDELLFPIGTLYDPFLKRGLDAFVYSVYSGSKFILVGTPSGITLGPEGGAHQSLITPSIGVEVPELSFYEPCFGQELEWIILSSLENIRTRTESTYLRLSSQRIDQSLFNPPQDPKFLELLRKQVIYGAYKQIDRSMEHDYNPKSNVVNIACSGVMVPEAIKASNNLLEEGIFANVINVTGPGPLYREFQKSIRASISSRYENSRFLSDVVPEEDRLSPLITLADGHPHSLAWLGGALCSPTFPLGVTEYGQSGNPPELYEEYGIDVQNIMATVFSSLGM